MSKLVDLANKFLDYQFACDELDEIERAWDRKKNINDIVDYTGDKLVDAMVRYSGFMTQVYAATSAFVGTYTPSEAIEGIIFIEYLKAMTHFFVETNIPRRIVGLKIMKKIAMSSG